MLCFFSEERSLGRREFLILNLIVSVFPFLLPLRPEGSLRKGGKALSTKAIRVKINGKDYTHEVEPRLLLIHYIRDIVGLTGSHIGCETSLCGACTVIMDGMAVKACTLLAVQADGSEIMTIEGLAQNGQLHPIQEGFWERHGLQCGYCTPGMILTAYQLLQRNPNPTEEEIRHGLEGNLCRCTGYQHIVDAVQYAAQKMRG